MSNTTERWTIRGIPTSARFFKTREEALAWYGSGADVIKLEAVE